MAKSIQCTACGKKVRVDSQFCRYCGAKLTTGTPESIPDEATLIQQSVLIKTDLEKAINACHAYFQHYPDGAAIMDMDLTNSIILSFLSMHQIANKFPEIRSQQDYTSNANRCNYYFPHDFTILKNGIVIDLRIKDKEKRKNALTKLAAWQNICEFWLNKAYEAAESEKENLLVDGKTRALVEEKTMEEIYRDAEIYYKFYTDGNYDDATRGFEYLKELNPMDAYFRSILGACYSQQGKTQDAIREYIYGYHLDPGSPNIASSLIRELTTLHLHGAAYAVYCHFQQYKQEGGTDDAVQIVEVLGKTAKLCTQGLVSVLVDITEQDYDPREKDIMDEFTCEEKPWLIAPPESKSREHIVLDNKKIFISYRHADSEEMANKIQAKLKADYPPSKVFLDKSSMVGGEAFTEQIRNEIDNADVFLILISPYWNKKQGKARIKETADILRRELLRAVRKEITIVPVLINGAKIPTKQSLPKDLQFLTQLHALHVSDTSFSSDMGFLESNLTSVLTEVTIRKKRFEQEMHELEKLEQEDPDTWEKEMEEMIESSRDYFGTYVPAKSEHGEGIPEAKMNIFGVWESVVVAPNGAKSTIDIDIEDQAGSIYTGTLKTVDPYGNVLADLELSGNWSKVIDIDKKLFLGFSLTYVKPDNTPGTLFIPFHRKIGHNYIGDDTHGLHFSSTNIEPRASGF